MSGESVQELTWVLVAGLAGVAGLVAARFWRARAGGPMVDAVAAGVLVGLLIAAVPRLTGSAMVVLARVLPGLQPDVRSQASTVGPVLIQNLVAALVIGTYLTTIWWQRRRHAPHPEHVQPAGLFAFGLGLYAVAEGLSSGSNSVRLTIGLELLAGGVIAYIGRGLALSGASSGGFVWLVIAAVLGAPLTVLGRALARGVGFEMISPVAVLVWVSSVALLVLLIALLVGPGLGGGARRLPVAGFLAGLGLVVASARLIGSNF
jgi:hypothetical protein